MPKSSDLTPSAMSALEVLYRLSQIARGDIADFIDENGRITLKGNTWLVKHYKKQGNTTEIELHSALDALCLLVQYHGLISRHQRRRVTEEALIPVFRS